MKVLAIGASSHSKSINSQLAQYAASLINNAEVELLDLNDYEMPIFSQDKEQQIGQPEQAQQFIAKIAAADALVISFAEHNGSYTAAYKNIFDWASRIEKHVFQQTPVIMLATSPGPGGASSVLASAVTSAPYFAGDVKGSLSIPSFYDNFDVENQQLTNEDLAQQLNDLMRQLNNNI